MRSKCGERRIAGRYHAATGKLFISITVCFLRLVSGNTTLMVVARLSFGGSFEEHIRTQHKAF